MAPRTRRVLWALGGCLLGSCLFAAAGIGFLYYLFVVREWPGGMSPGYPAVNYDPRLTRVAATAAPAIAALNRYRSKHSTFPAVAKQLAPYLPSRSAPPGSLKEGYIFGWYYSKTANGNGYSLSRILGWDPFLSYEFVGSKGHWVFHPGDGSPARTIILKP